MKSPIIYQNNRGFLIVEIMISFSILIMFMVSSFILITSIRALKVWSIKELSKMEDLVKKIDNDLVLKTRLYSNDSIIYYNDLFNKLYTDLNESWGRNTCNIDKVFDKEKIEIIQSNIDTGGSNPATDIEVRNGIVYLTNDSTISSQPDLYIFDARDTSNIKIISSINTGPGVSALEVAGPYIFLAQASTVNQLQIVDIHDRRNPLLTSQLKLPLPSPTTTAPFATSTFYSKNYIYLGTTKWNGAEFNIIDISNIRNPIVIGSLETNTLINDIYVRGDIAYLASSDDMQLRVINVGDKTKPYLINSFSPNGWQTQQGKIVDYFMGEILFGRTVGGFNVINNHELFYFSTSSQNLSNYISKDIPSGVYGIINSLFNKYILSRLNNSELQVFDSDLNSISNIHIEDQPIKMTCDNSNIYFALPNSHALSILKIK